MKRRHKKTRRPVRPTSVSQANRDGATLVVVVALLGMLAVTGYMAYRFANQEQGNAEYFAEGAKVTRVDPACDTVFLWALKQIILGAPDSLKNSALWGGRHSLLANMFGRDVHPYSGRGINLIDNGAGIGLPAIDQDYNNVPDAGVGHLFNINDSRAAQHDGTTGIGALYSFNDYPHPDVNYTAPDINNAFLAFRGYSYDENNHPVFTVIPSYHRPQYLREASGLVARPYRIWDVDPSYRSRTLRAHMDHRVIGSSNAITPGTVDPGGRRYIRTLAEATTLGVARPFPFSEDLNGNGVLDPGEDTNGNGVLDILGGNEDPSDPSYLSKRAEQGAFDLTRWQASSTYEIGQWVAPSSSTGTFYRCIIAGTSGTVAIESLTVTPPTPPRTQPEVIDGSVTWEVWPQLRYAFDADADGDGIKEAVWLDLDFPVQRRGDGKLYIPMFAITIYDADGLANLNAAANTAGNVNLSPVYPAAFPFGNGAFLSRSNQGLYPSEINLGYILNGRANAAPVGDLNPADDPAEVFRQHDAFYYRPATSLSGWLELSNMELFWLKKGRLHFDAAGGSGSITDAFPGQYGELGRLSAGWTTKNRADFPFPGLSLADDNSNRNRGEGSPFLATLPFRHPLDFASAGRSVDSTGKQPRFYGPDALNRFLQYLDYHTRGTVPWASTSVFGGNLMVTASGGATATSPTDSLMDEPVESVVEPALASPADDIFGASESAFLQLTNSQITSSGISSRLRELAPWNLFANLRSRDIRERLTPISFDLKTFGKPFHGDPTTEPAILRPWEFRDTGATNSLGETRYDFPPIITSISASSNAQPIRPALRELLRLLARDVDRTPTLQRQRLLSLNHVVTMTVGPTGTPVVDFRDLTEHPSNPGTATIPDGVSAPVPYPPTSAAEQEYWARRDRQMMARDIYVLLYIFGGGENTNVLANPNTLIDPTTGQRAIYDENQLREMAQFAINTVNALDRETVIDLFEYDKDLNNGWNLGDNPYTTDDDGSSSSTERGVVYGVESQMLTLSEAMVVRWKAWENSGVASDHLATEFNDTLDRYFTYLELRNTAPLSITFDNGAPGPADNGAWQIELEIDNGTPPTSKRHLTLLADDPAFGGNAAIPGGGLFNILSAGDEDNVDSGTGTVRPSYIMTDLAYDPATGAPSYTERILPFNNSARKVDLINDDIRFSLVDPASGATVSAGGFVNATNASGVAAGSKLTFRLRRRAHLGRAALPATSPAVALADYDADNPWIEVDKIEITPGEGWADVQIADGANKGEDVKVALVQQAVKSKERVEPLNRNDEQLFTPNPPLPTTSAGIIAEPNFRVKLNSFGNDNSVSLSTGNPFQLWQPHFDRDFASTMELLAVPLYAPRDLTGMLADPADTEPNMGTHSAGERKFLRPEHPLNVPLPPGSKIPKLDNRWYRLFAFAEVPTRTNAPERYRSPGKINVNTMRHPEVYAAWLDDQTAFDPSSGFFPLIPANNQNEYLQDASGETPGSGLTRDWWLQFIRSRDRQDPLTGFYLPAMAHSRPFRDFDHLAHGTASIEHTLLRSLPADAGGIPVTQNRRRLLEVGTQSEHTNHDVDHYTKHRLLSKVAGNSTTRSNVFFVFIRVGYFEVADDGGVMRIGGQLTDEDDCRGFFVVDRSLAFEQLKPADFRSPSDPAVFSFKDETVGGFDFRSIITHRLTLD